MAEFSKQWCEQSGIDMPWDFDILKEAEGLGPNETLPLICEGYGFDGITKDSKNNVLLRFHNWQDGTTNWIPYNILVK